jgi:hypothetical protein
MSGEGKYEAEEVTAVRGPAAAGVGDPVPDIEPDAEEERKSKAFLTPPKAMIGNLVLRPYSRGARSQLTRMMFPARQRLRMALAELNLENEHRSDCVQRGKDWECGADCPAQWHATQASELFFKLAIYILAADEEEVARNGLSPAKFLVACDKFANGFDERTWARATDRVFEMIQAANAADNYEIEKDAVDDDPK